MGAARTLNVAPSHFSGVDCHVPIDIDRFDAGPFGRWTWCHVDFGDFRSTPDGLTAKYSRRARIGARSRGARDHHAESRRDARQDDQCDGGWRIFLQTRCALQGEPVRPVLDRPLCGSHISRSGLAGIRRRRPAGSARGRARGGLTVDVRAEKSSLSASYLDASVRRTRDEALLLAWTAVRRRR